MKISRGAEFATARLNKAGFSAFLVGGAPRDFVMGKNPHDFDIATSATPDEMLDIFSDVTTFRTGVSHGTVSVFYEGETVEITTFRSDGDYIDHRHPEKVTFSKELRDDLSRRDFTVNAMAYSPEKGIIDPFDGREDISKKLIRCVGVPANRFEEDALRILRALRFASTLGFKVETETKKAIFEKKELIFFVSKERIAEELKKTLDGDNILAVAEEFHEVFALLFANLPPNFGEYIVKVEKGTPRLSVFLSTLDDYKKSLDFLTLTRKESTLIDGAIKLSREGLFQSENELKMLVSKNGKERVSLALDILFSESGEERFLNLRSCLKTIEEITPETLAVSGKDVVALGVFPSPEVGRIIEELILDVIEGRAENDKESLISAIREKIAKK